MDFTEARDDERQWHQLDHIIHTSLQTDNDASTSSRVCTDIEPLNLKQKKVTERNNKRKLIYS